MFSLSVEYMGLEKVPVAKKPLKGLAWRFSLQVP